MRPTLEEVRDEFLYDPITGVLLRRSTRDEAGHVWKHNSSNLYRRVVIRGKFYFAHRLIWFYMTGRWPTCTVDHRNGDGLDNRWDNLREAEGYQQSQNLKAASNKHGFLGVWKNSNGRFVARIKVKGKLHRGPVRGTAEEAHKDYLNMKSQLHTFNPTVRH